MDRKPLPTWVHPKGRVVLLGDACHPMLVRVPLTWARRSLIISSLTAHKALRLPSKMQQSSALYSRTSRHFHKCRLFYMHTKTFGARLPTLFSLAKTHFWPLPKKRLPRATATQESSRLNQNIFHLPDGPEQRARDDAMRAAMAAELDGEPIPDGNPNQWADRTKSRFQFDYDAYAEVEQWWTGGGKERIEALAGGSGCHDSSAEVAVKTDYEREHPRSPHLPVARSTLAGILHFLKSQF